MRRTLLLSICLLSMTAGLARAQVSGVIKRRVRFPAGPGSIVYQYPEPVVARGQVTQVISRTAYFPGGPGSVVLYRARQGTGSYTGMRRTVTHYGKRWLTKAEMDNLKRQYKFKDKKFGVHRSWTITTIRKQAF